MKLLKTLLLISTFLPCFAEVDFRNHPQFVDKIEFFYIDPTPETAKQILKEASDLNCLDSIKGVTTALAKEYPSSIVGWMSDNGFTDDCQTSLVNSLYFAGLQEQAIQTALKANWPAQTIASLRIKPEPVLNLSPNFPNIAQFMSDHFCITGDERYVKKIINLLEPTPADFKNPNHFNQSKQETLALLKELAFKHHRIYTLLLKESNKKTGQVKKDLTLLLDELHDLHKKNLFKGDGMFRGTILVTDDLDFDRKWEEMPVMSGPFGQPIASIPYPMEETSITIYMLFTGADLDDNLSAHVTCDVEVFSPDKTKIYEDHAIPATSRKIPSRFFVQKVEKSIGIKLQPYKKGCEKFYSTGIYTIQATLKDHISQKEITLQQSFELLSNETIDAILQSSRGAPST